MWRQSVCCQEKTNKQLKNVEIKGFRAKVHFREPPGILFLLHMTVVLYTSKYALSGMVFCGHCEDIYRRVYWNNRGKKKYVWRCVSRVLKKSSGIDCPARTIEETALHDAVVTAVNDAFAQKNIVIPLLKQNIEEVINDDLEKKIRDIDKQLAELQIELINVSGDELAVERLGTEIVDLRVERKDILTAAAERKDLQLRMQELIDFLNEQHTAITEYSETLTRRLVEKVTILDEKIVVTLSLIHI